MLEVKTIRVSVDNIPPYIKMNINTKRMADRIKMCELNNPPVINTESQYVPG